jgi:cytosine/adenosine deaminase-related metal-dependent hydrolase
MTAIYSANWVLPIASPAIQNGAVAIDDSTIVGVGAHADMVARFPGASISDFGDAAILPGLVNTHSHLELTVMRGFLEREEEEFFGWLGKLTVTRQAMASNDLFGSAMLGAAEAARAGITCVGDSSASAIEVIFALRTTGQRAIVYQESFGPDPKLAPEKFANLRLRLNDYRKHETDLVRLGVSPHALYTVSAPQLELISRLAIDEDFPLMMHAAESAGEKSLLFDKSGAFAQAFKERGIDWDPPGISTIQYLKRHGVLETEPLLAHCINVDDADLEAIKESGAGIAHCPKSNAKLGHGRAPFAKFLSHGINVGLGSDSVASNNTCDILEEARFATLLARIPLTDDGSSEGERPPVITSDQALFAATLGGARALHLDDRIGALTEGMQADLIAVNLDGDHQQPIRNPADALIFSSSGRDVLMTMVAGKEIYRAGRFDSVDEEELRTRVAQIQALMDLTAGN